MTVSSSALSLVRERVSCAWENNVLTSHPEYTKVQSSIDKAFGRIESKLSINEIHHLETAITEEARLQAEMFYVLGVQDALSMRSRLAPAF
jgi:hypothetical protein